MTPYKRPNAADLLEMVQAGDDMAESLVYDIFNALTATSDWARDQHCALAIKAARVALDEYTDRMEAADARREEMA